MNRSGAANQAARVRKIINKLKFKIMKQIEDKKHPKHGKTCKSCGHLIYWLKNKGYRCFCDKCNA